MGKREREREKEREREREALVNLKNSQRPIFLTKFFSKIV